MYLYRFLVKKNSVGLISAVCTCQTIFWTIHKCSQIWVAWETNNRERTQQAARKQIYTHTFIVQVHIKQNGYPANTNRQKYRFVKTLHMRHAAPERAEKPFASDTQPPLSLCESVSLNRWPLQMSTLHHCENWCFWAVQSGVEHIRAQDIWAQQSAERQAHPPLEGSNLYHLTLKDLWV